MEAQARTASLMFLELANLVVLLGGIWALSPLGLAWSAGAVGIAFGSYAVAGVWMISHNGPSLRRLAFGFLQPLAACGVMAASVLASRRLFTGAPAAVELAAELGVGALAYIAAALVLCRANARDLIALAADLIRRRGAAPA
jgi:hypothetical protein